MFVFFFIPIPPITVSGNPTKRRMTTINKIAVKGTATEIREKEKKNS